MEVVPLTLELSGGVDLVGHDASDGLKRNVVSLYYVNFENDS